MTCAVLRFVEGPLDGGRIRVLRHIPPTRLDTHRDPNSPPDADGHYELVRDLVDDHPKIPETHYRWVEDDDPLADYTPDWRQRLQRDLDALAGRGRPETGEETFGGGEDL